MNTPDRVQEFRDRGYLVERGFFSNDEIAAVLADIHRCEAEDHPAGPCHGDLVFTTETFRRSETVQRFVSQQRVIDYLAPIAGGDLWVRWDQAVTKQPGAGVFHWHQDNAFNKLQTEHFQLWIALTESHRGNGGLWLAPGSHRRGRLPHVRRPGQRVVQAEIGDKLCVDASAGDMILFSSLMLHRTGPNEADTARTAFVVEYMPLADYDYAACAPHFVVAENGCSRPRFVERQPGATPANRRRYWRESGLRWAAQPLRALRGLVLGASPSQ